MGRIDGDDDVLFLWVARRQLQGDGGGAGRLADATLAGEKGKRCDVQFVLSGATGSQPVESGPG